MAEKICQCGHGRSIHLRGVRGCQHCTETEGACLCLVFTEPTPRETKDASEEFDRTFKFNATGEAKKFEERDNSDREDEKKFAFKKRTANACNHCGHSVSHHAFGAKECMKGGCICKQFEKKPEYSEPKDGALLCNCSHRLYGHDAATGSCLQDGCLCVQFMPSTKGFKEAEAPPQKDADAPRTWWMQDIGEHNQTPGYQHRRDLYVDEPYSPSDRNMYIRVRECSPELERTAREYMTARYVELIGFVRDNGGPSGLDVPLGENVGDFIMSALKYHLARNKWVRSNAVCNHGNPYRARWKCPDCLNGEDPV